MSADRSVFLDLKPRTQEIIARELGQPKRRTPQGLFYFCPFHQEKNTPSFCVYSDHWFCFGSCGRSGDVVDFVQAHHRLRGIKEALEYLDRYYHAGCQANPEAVRLYEEQRKAQREAEQEQIQIARARFAQSRLWQTYHDQMDSQARALWTQAGIRDGWQDFWTLGYADRVPYSDAEEVKHSPALTIPFATFTNSKPSEVVTLQYRLLNPNGGGRYRFHKHEGQSLGSAAWVARPQFHAGDGEFCLVVEGAKKAAVAYIALYEVLKDNFQVVAVPSMSSSGGAIPDLRLFPKVYFWLDPEAWAAPANSKKSWIPWPIRFCRETGSQARFIQNGVKPDDMILKYNLSGQELLRLIRANARRPAVS